MNKVAGTKGQVDNMKNIYSKLNNNDGKTILMALFLLLVAVVVSVVVITAASTAAHQLNDNKEAQQAYLTVSSAAQLFRDEIENKVYTHTRKVYTPLGSAPLKDDANDYTYPEGKLGETLKEIAQIVESDTQVDSSRPYKQGTIKVKKSGADDTAKEFDDVNIKIYIQQAGTSNDMSSSKENYYDMDITFEAAGKSKDEYGYKMNLAINIEKTMTTATTTLIEGERWYNQNRWNVATTTTTITFDSGVLTRDGINSDGGVQQ